MPAGHAAHRGCGGEAQVVRAPLWPALLKVGKGQPPAGSGGGGSPKGQPAAPSGGVAGEAVLN